MAITTIHSIPREITADILKDVILHDGTFTCRFVCKKWKNIIDTEVLKIFVTQLQRRLKEIPQTLELHSMIITFTDRANPKEITTLQCGIKTFLTFNEQLKTALGPQIGLIAFPKKIEELAKKDTNLPILWDAIKGQVTPPPSSPLQTGSEINAWMKANPEAMASITSLDLSSKGLTALPPEIGLLSRLQILNLENNQISKLPSEIGQLTQLLVLNLGNNQITRLPFEIEKLTLLQQLYLENNKIAILPYEIAKLLQLKHLIVYGNPLLFIHGKFLSSYNYVFYFNLQIEQFKNERTYSATSAFAQLYQSIVTRKNENELSEKIKTAFKKLKKDDQNLIYEMVYFCSGSPKTSDLQWGEHRVFDKPDIFFRAVRMAGLHKFNQLNQDSKNRVYGLVYDLAGKPKTNDAEWGQNYALTNLTRLFDALSVIAPH